MLRVPLEDILASPVFRARDTAELAFGTERITVTMDLWSFIRRWERRSTSPTQRFKHGEVSWPT